MTRVLVVDDVKDNITLLSFELEDHGFDVISAASADECLKAVHATPQPEIILLDIQMPGMSGIETLAALKSNPATEDIPVIMVSADDTNETIIETLDLGAHDFVSKPIEYHVLAARMRSALRLSTALADLEKANAELNKLATSDTLTGCYNRRQFFALAEKEVDKAHRSERPLSLIMLDIDHFKRINDTYGHAMGDRALGLLADCFRQCSRRSDILGRIGGEEFAICCPEAALEGARNLAERIRTACESLVLTHDEHRISMTLSLGVTQLHSQESFQQALQRADLLLYEAKGLGRNRSAASPMPSARK